MGSTNHVLSHKRGHSYEDADWDSGPPHESWANLVVENLKWEVDWKHLKELFQSTVKGVKYAKVAQEPDGRSAGHGIVQYQNPQQAAEAMRQLQGYVLMQRPMVIRMGNQNPGRQNPGGPRGSRAHIPHGPISPAGGYGQPPLQPQLHAGFPPHRAHQMPYGAGMDAGMGDMPPVPVEFAQAFMQQQGLDPALGEILASRTMMAGGMGGMGTMGSGYLDEPMLPAGAGSGGGYRQDGYGGDARSGRGEHYQQQHSPTGRGGRSSYPAPVTRARPGGHVSSALPHANGGMHHGDNNGRGSSRLGAAPVTSTVTGVRARAEDVSLEARRAADAKRLKPNTHPSWRQLDVPTGDVAVGHADDDAFDAELNRTMDRAMSQDHNDMAVDEPPRGSFRGHLTLSSGRTVNGDLGSGFRREPSPGLGSGARGLRIKHEAGGVFERHVAGGAGGGLSRSHSSSLQASPTAVAAAVAAGSGGQAHRHGGYSRGRSPYMETGERFEGDGSGALDVEQEQQQQQQQGEEEPEEGEREDLYEGLFAHGLGGGQGQLDAVEQQGWPSDQDVPEAPQHSRKAAADGRKGHAAAKGHGANVDVLQQEHSGRSQRQVQPHELQDQQVQTEQDVPDGEPGIDYVIFGRRLAVVNCPSDASTADITAHFSAVGPVSEVQLLETGGTADGQALVVFERAVDAVEALGRLSNVEFMGRQLSVSMAPVVQEPEEEPPICQVLVQGLPLSYGEPQVREMMEEAGPVTSVTTYRDTLGDVQVTCATVVFETAAGAAEAVEMLDGSMLLKRKLAVRLDSPLLAAAAAAESAAAAAAAAAAETAAAAAEAAAGTGAAAAAPADAATAAVNAA